MCILFLSGAFVTTDSFAADDPKQITLHDMGVLQLVAHDLFDVKRGDNMTPESAVDIENGRVDLSTLFVNMTDGSDFDDDVIAKGGEVRNRENVILFTVSAALGQAYLDFKAAGDSEQAAKRKTIAMYHGLFATAYQNTFDEPIPAKKRGAATSDGNIALRTVHDFLPGKITFNGTATALLSIPPNIKLSDSELMQLTSPLDGELDEEFLAIQIDHPGGPTITVNLLEADQTFGDQFSTRFSFDEMLEELRDGSYDANDKAMQEIRELISTVYPRQITLHDMGVLQLVAHDLFDVKRGDNMTPESAVDIENGRVDLSTLFVNMTDGSDFDDDVIAKGGEVRNRENVILFTVSAALGQAYLDFKAAGDSEQAAKRKTIAMYHGLFATAYQNTFDEPIPAKKRGAATSDGNIALRTVHDFLPGQITFNGTTTALLSIPPNIKLSDSELMQLTSPLDGELDEEFLAIQIDHPGGPTITVNLLEADQTFGDQFSTRFSFDEMLEELQDGSYGANDKAMQEIRELISIAYPEAYVRSKSNTLDAPMVDMGALVKSGTVSIPPRILQMYESPDSLLTKPVVEVYPFDFPLAINGKNYLIADDTSTLQTQQVVTGNVTEITFTVYSRADLAHFALYFNLHGNDVDYSHSDTYVEYDGDIVSIYDPQGHISDGGASVTIAEDAQQPNKKIVRITVEFEEAIGLTNMVAYMWNENRQPAFIRIINALDVVRVPDVQAAEPEQAAAAATAEGSEHFPDTGLETLGGNGDAFNDDNNNNNNNNNDGDAKSNTRLSNDADTLLCIRMWAGFEPEPLSDAGFLTMVGLDYPDAGIPNWMMTDLGVMASKGMVTVDEFMVSLVYVLESVDV